MNDELHQKEHLIFKVSICAVIFGADESLLKVQISDSYQFEKKSLIPSKDHLYKIFETTDMGLRHEYETARLDNESLDVICICKKYKVEVERKNAREYYNNMYNKALAYLDNRIRAIRLHVEAPVRFKKLSIKMESEIERIEESDTRGNFNSMIPISEAVGTRELSRFHCSDSEIGQLNSDIVFVDFPLRDDILNNCHKYYDLSYHQDNCISITLLITCLEMLFLYKKDKKNENLSQRCAIYLYEDKGKRLNCYNKLRLAYKIRSKFVHNGDCDLVRDENILFLRDCTRRSIIKYLHNNSCKKNLIQGLKEVIDTLPESYWKNGYK